MPFLPPPPPPVERPAPAAVARDSCAPVGSAALASLVAAERAFARLSVDSGAQVAFLANLAEGAVLFRPGPVPGRAFQEAHPVPPNAGTLAWSPHWAGVSRAGDLGFTSGPWAITGGGRVAARGTFNSVWARRAGGPWRVLFDVGVADSTAAPAAVAVGACGPVTIAAAPDATAPGDSAAALAAVLRADSLLGRDPEHPAAGLAAVVAPDARLVREHRPVVVGAVAARAEARRAGGGPRGVPLGGGVAGSRDLAYMYGTYALAARPGAAPERGHYLRVWRAGPRGWALVLDVTNAMPTARRAASTLPVALFAYDRRAPLALRDSAARVVEGVTVRPVSFASPKGGRATGRLYLPPDSARRGRDGRFAGLVMLHGAPGNAAGVEFAVLPLARAGAVVLSVDAPFARRDARTPLSFTPRDSVDLVQYVVDLRRAVDVLAARADVDTARLGAMGISFGGAVGALLAGVEPRLTTHVLSVADGGSAAHYTDAAGGRLPPPPDTPAAQWSRWYDAMEPLDATRFVARAAGARFLFLWGRHDALVRPRLAHALWRAAPAAKQALWYDTGHFLPPAAGDDVQRWLATHLGLAAPPVPEGRAADYAGAYSGWGAHRDVLELEVVADTAGRLGLQGPFTGPDDRAGLLRYLGRTAAGEAFRLDDKRLTFVRENGRVTALHLDAPIDAPPDAPRFHLVLTRAPGR